MKRYIQIDERVIFALDVNNIHDVNRWIDLLKHEIKIFKIGLELFVSMGFDVVDRVMENGFHVMLDLQLYDIPQTVKRTVKEISKRNIKFLTVHGNFDILKAAVDGADNLKILGVTVLTSLDEKDLKDMGYEVTTEELVLKRARLAKDAGCYGVVASGMEAKIIRKKLGDDFVIVTPGIRPGYSDVGDQKRVLTPEEALKNGADYLVIGRPIRNSKNPLEMVRKIKQSIKKVL